MELSPKHVLKKSLYHRTLHQVSFVCILSIRSNNNNNNNNNKIT
ncbi:hypothetical protein ACMBCN_01155 [Candidatus Liberibacter asiaticus]